MGMVQTDIFISTIQAKCLTERAEIDHPLPSKLHKCLFCEGNFAEKFEGKESF